jgi:deoxyribose-phosphate aldolase
MQGTITTFADLAPLIDHTLLKPQVTSQEIERLCHEALTHHFKAVCVNPVFVALARQTLNEVAKSPVLIASVIGFPLGASQSSVKAHECELAIKDGANEIDMVMRIDYAKEGRWNLLRDDIAAVVKAAAGSAVKVILETGLLSTDEIAQSCRAAAEAGAAFVKTSTGFLGRGASVEDILLMRKSCGPNVKIKASGGIKNFAQAVALVEAGADRLGTSSGVLLVTGHAVGEAGY